LFKERKNLSLSASAAVTGILAEYALPKWTMDEGGNRNGKKQIQACFLLRRGKAPKAAAKNMCLRPMADFGKEIISYRGLSDVCNERK